MTTAAIMTKRRGGAAGPTPLVYYSRTVSGNIAANGTWPDQMGYRNCQLAGGASVGLNGMDAGADRDYKYGVVGQLPTVTKQFTAMCWAYGNNNVSYYPRLFADGKGANSRIHVYMQQYSQTIGVTVNTTDGDSNTRKDCFSAAAITNGTWWHVAFVYTGGLIQVYIDGQLDAQIAGTDDPLIAQPYDMWLGWNPVQSFNEDWGGTLDEWRIYNVGLTQVQIQSDMAVNARK